MEGLKILYLEDEPIVAMDTGALLASLGFDRVEVAYRLANAKALNEAQNFDLALLDINVDRGQTSLDLGREIAATGTPVVFASGNSSTAIELKAEGFYFLDKPFTHLALTEMLKEATARG